MRFSGSSVSTSGSVPLSFLFLFVCAVGIAAALAGGNELRLSPRHALVTNSFLVYGAFVMLVALPTAVYFYVFHGDWFLHYVADVRRIPSAVAMLGFIALVLLFVGSFVVGAAFARSQHVNWGFAAIGVLILLGAVVFLLWPDRWRMVGTYPQFRGNFGLHPYGGVLRRGGVAMAFYLIAGTFYLLLRIRLGVRR